MAVATVSPSCGQDGLSVIGSGSTARIALGMTGWSDGSKQIQVSDDSGTSWHEVEAGMSHPDGDTCVGWIEDVTIDPANRDHIMHTHGGGVCETANATKGASIIALGKAKSGAAYTAAVYVVGTMNGVWGIYRSDDAGATWARFNDDAHQFGGIGVMAADWNTYGRIYVNGAARGLLYSN